MSSNLFVFDGSIFSDPFSTFNDSVVSIDHILQENYSSNTKSYNQVDELNQIASTLLSSSPPSHQMENLSLYPTPHLANEYPGFSSLGVKTEGLQVPFYSTTCDINCNNNYSSSFPSYGNESGKMMQRSFSSNCFDGKPSFLFQPRFDNLMESTVFSTAQVQASSSPEKTSSSSSRIKTSSSSSHMRRVCSAGDLQSKKRSEIRGRLLSSSPLATESSFMEEANSKVGRYSAEERKERIHRYRAKRTQRNFNKTIKYACRKTLADNRPRIRGRFARNDEPVDIPKTANFNRYEDDEDELWMEGFYEEENEGRGGLLNNYGFQYYMPTS